MAGILTVQIKSVCGDKNVNLRKVEHFIKRNSDKNLDLVVLPELFLAGVDYREHIMPENGGEVIEFVKTLAQKYNTNIVAGSIVRCKNERFYNTAFVINREGVVVGEYDKIYLNNYMGENEGELIQSGSQLISLNLDFAKIGLAIGFDIRIPNHFTKLVKENVDLIVVPTSWTVCPEVYGDETNLSIAQEMWQAICKTRAYDNGVYLVIANQTKQLNQDKFGLGQSMIIAPTAQIIANAQDKECGVFADVDVNLVKYMRQLIPISKLN